MSITDASGNHPWQINFEISVYDSQHGIYANLPFLKIFFIWPTSVFPVKSTGLNAIIHVALLSLFIQFCSQTYHLLDSRLREFNNIFAGAPNTFHHEKLSYHIYQLNSASWKKNFQRHFLEWKLLYFEFVVTGDIGGFNHKFSIMISTFGFESMVGAQGCIAATPA